MTQAEERSFPLPRIPGCHGNTETPLPAPGVSRARSRPFGGLPRLPVAPPAPSRSATQAANRGGGGAALDAAAVALAEPPGTRLGSARSSARSSSRNPLRARKKRLLAMASSRVTSDLVPLRDSEVPLRRRRNDFVVEPHLQGSYVHTSKSLRHVRLAPSRRARKAPELIEKKNGPGLCFSMDAVCVDDYITT
ncbi:unnamed protein product [Ixodes persulcatus]